MANPVVYGDVVTVSYTAPATNPLQTSAGGKATNISAKSVTNNVTTTVPVYLSSVIENASPSILTMNYNLSLASIVPATSAFGVLVNSAIRPVSAVAIIGGKAQLTLASPVVYGDIVTVSYTVPATNSLQTASGGKAASISSKSVTNNVIAAVPVYSSSVIENASPSIMTMTYNLSLADIVPSTSAFSVLVNSAIRTVSAVAIVGGKAQLTLTSPVVYGDVVTVSYTAPATNQLQTVSGGKAENNEYLYVTNNVTAPVAPIEPETSTSKIKMTIYPNPAQEFINILLVFPNFKTIEDPVLSSIAIKIYNISGELMSEEIVEDGKSTFQIPINLKSGIYIVQLLSNDLTVSAEKLIVYN